jgi:hypothetical protein
MRRLPGAPRRYQLFLGVLTIVGLALILAATSKYGAGVSSDAARNLSTADNVLAGRGLIDMVGTPFVLWPPLYPVLLAGIAGIAGWSAFQAAWYLNVLLYGANIWLAGWWLYSVLPDRPLLAAVGTLIVLVSRSMLRIHANVASEPLFETLMFAVFFAATAYLRTGDSRAMWIMCIAAGLATLQRYPGIVLIGLAIVVILKREGVRGLVRRALPITLSGVPILVWILFHNLPVAGTLFGPRELGAMLPFQNVELSLTKVLWWFIPRYGFLDWLVLHPWVVIGLGLALLILINGRAPWARLGRRMGGEALWPPILFAVVYFLLMAFTVVTADHLDLTSDRYYVLLLPIVLAVVLAALDELVLSHLRLDRPIPVLATAAMASLWFVYPIYSLQSYIRQALVQGEPTNYNIANSAQFREMSIVRAAAPILARDPEALVYSNYLNIVWFIFRHPVAVLPYEDASLSRSERLDALKRNFPNWPDKGGYIIWFIPNQYHHIVAPDELSTIADLHLLYHDETGAIYLVDRR